jgi:hypothetical protein
MCVCVRFSFCAPQLFLVFFSLVFIFSSLFFFQCVLFRGGALRLHHVLPSLFRYPLRHHFYTQTLFSLVFFFCLFEFCATALPQFILLAEGREGSRIPRPNPSCHGLSSLSTTPTHVSERYNDEVVASLPTHDGGATRERKETKRGKKKRTSKLAKSYYI